MTVLATCPSCGFPSAEVRCPRCNALKVVGCDGGCSSCASACATGPACTPPARKAGADAAETTGEPDAD